MEMVVISHSRRCRWRRHFRSLVRINYRGDRSVIQPRGHIWQYVQSHLQVHRWCIVHKQPRIRKLSGPDVSCWTSDQRYHGENSFYGRLRLIRSVLRASKFSVLKLISIVILWVYNTIHFGFSLFRHFWGILFQLIKLLCLAKDHWRGFSTRNAYIVHIFN